MFRVWGLGLGDSQNQGIPLKGYYRGYIGALLAHIGRERVQGGFGASGLEGIILRAPMIRTIVLWGYIGVPLFWQITT